MKVKTKYYGVFYKQGKKWIGPSYGEFRTLKDIIWDSGLENENAPITEHVNSYLRISAKYLKKKVKLCNLVWEEKEI